MLNMCGSGQDQKPNINLNNARAITALRSPGFAVGAPGEILEKLKQLCPKKTSLSIKRLLLSIQIYFYL